MKPRKIFTGDSNLEFTLFPGKVKISEKVLYRSFGDTQIFRNSVLKHIIENTNECEMQMKIKRIFSLLELEHFLFHFGEDSSTGRLKFYISLYKVELKMSLQIISQIRDILGVGKYFLERDFVGFDCLGFDIVDSNINMKIYELLSVSEYYIQMLPEYIHRRHIREVGILKTQERKKIFFRFHNPIEIPQSYFSQNDFENFCLQLPLAYQLQGKMTYYCIEKDREEIYFI